ncbi:metallophosphoesterase family protein [Arcobacter caeni]|uniref:Phosphoesterase n=1 Tax=Arcobacter caeni TaxID=1912877 RepID=A0A363CY79_9BACT|nr:YfcE family phosphodiesterase [Arcobacter caeni]PUE63767.1 hypothetical protein B0174_09470 [Arcobacter caeni]
MKLVFISDIHSNSNYLSTVQKQIEDEKADMIFFLGDAIGYYDNPNYVLDWLRNINAHCIKGNHEKYFLDEINYDKKLENIYLVEINKQKITDENKDFINKWSEILDIVIDKKRFLMVHGDVESSENHIYNTESIDKDLFKKYDYYVFGHTHIPLVQYNYGCCVLNPGSIGQPRDYTKQSSYIVVDTNTQDVTIKKIKVKYEKYCQELELKFYDKKVIDILKRERK